MNSELENYRMKDGDKIEVDADNGTVKLLTA